MADKVKGKVTGAAQRWLEVLEVSGEEIIGKFENGDVAQVASGNHHYLACWPDAKLLNSVVKFAAKKAHLEVISLPEGFRLRRRGHLLFAFNYGNRSWKLTVGKTLLLGRRLIKPQEIAIAELT